MCNIVSAAEELKRLALAKEKKKTEYDLVPRGECVQHCEETEGAEGAALDDGEDGVTIPAAFLILFCEERGGEKGGKVQLDMRARMVAA